jgi:2-oxoglutarate dehydrogenase E2 component (dihydrolipoamide succinyltransferase)
MAEFHLVMPKMGESVIEATILGWRKQPGDQVHENEIILEVATDKVDSEVPSPVSGVVKSLLYKEGDVVAVDEAIAIIEVEGEKIAGSPKPKAAKVEKEATVQEEVKEKPKDNPEAKQQSEPEKVIPQPVQEIEPVPYVPVPQPSVTTQTATPSAGRFYSPLVLNIARTEGISMTELEALPGSGLEGRVTKEDILAYVAQKKKGVAPIIPAAKEPTHALEPVQKQSSAASFSGGNEIIEMDRMRKLIAKNMVDSKRISAHVSSFVEVDMTKVVKWREKHKESFRKREGFNLTYMPIFAEAIAKAIKDFPMINISVDGDKIIKKKDINIGIATALPSGNLIVPVVKNADRMNLSGLAASINILANKARNNQLSPSDIEGGTYTISNIGTFGNILGTPIIPQPQVAIMAVGAITKKPVVLETAEGDVIAIRHMMYLSHTYDHRVVDGALGGMFVKRVAEYLESFDDEQDI